MKVEDVALRIYCALVAGGKSDAPEAEKRAVMRQAFRDAAEFISVCQEQMAVSR